MKHSFNVLVVLCGVLAGCVSAPPIKMLPAPSVAPVRASVSAARAAVVAVSENVRKADGSIQAAQAGAAALAAVAPVELQPAVTELRGNLESARVELVDAATTATLAAVKLDEAEGRSTTLQGAIDAQTMDLEATMERANKVTVQLAAMTLDRNEYRGLTWQWRLICLGGVLSVGAFFVARQYFPFLKFI
jgi:hypothetical protein